MGEAVVGTATVELKTDGTWKWGATQTDTMTIALTVGDQAVAKLKANHKAVALASHVQNLTASLAAVPYFTDAFLTPGTVKVNSLTATASTLSQRLKRGAAVVLTTTSGTLAATIATAATTSSAPTSPDLVLAKSGTWKITDSGQGQPPKLKAV